VGKKGTVYSALLFVFCSATRLGRGLARGEGRAQRTTCEWDLRAHVAVSLGHVRSLPPRERVQRAGPRAPCLILEARDVFHTASAIRITPYLSKSPCVSSPRLADDLMSDGTYHTSSTCFLGEACLYAVDTNRAPLLRSASRMACKITCRWDGRRGLLLLTVKRRGEEKNRWSSTKTAT